MFKHVPHGLDVVPVYCFDPRHYSVSNWKTLQCSSRKTSSFKGKFLIDTVADLQQSLRGIGSDLLVFHEKPELVLPELVSADHGDMIVVQQECTSEETLVVNSVEEQLAAKGATLHSFFGHTLHHVDDLPFPHMEVPELFTTMRNLLEKSGAEVPVRPLVPSPAVLPSADGLTELRAQMLANSAVHFQQTIPTLFDLGYTPDEGAAASAAATGSLPTPSAVGVEVMAFRGGERAALERVEEYCGAGLGRIY
jgi:deoxyribodipyrimidine photo-lyase